MPTDAPATTEVHSKRVNVADRLAIHAAERPDELALVAYDGRSRRNGDGVKRRWGGIGDSSFSTATFAHLEREATALARGLAAMGVRPGHQIALLVKPGIEFVTLVFALLRSGATMVLVDGGLGRKNIVRCLESTSPDGFIAIPQGHALRVLMRRKFPSAKLNFTVGRRWFWGGETLDSLRALGGASDSFANTPPTDVGGSPSRSSAAQLPAAHCPLPTTLADDPAAIVFTSGSTGPPKGVVYRHETFVTQADEIQRQYDLQPGVVDLACFPLFGLFNVACGVTTVLPEMDFSRPASCDPKKLFAAANQWECTQSFASPAVWDKLSLHAEETGERIPTLRKVFSCGAPVPAKVIRRTLAMVHPEAELHTPYGATEALPVATIQAREILDETAAKTDEGAGVCVGKKFDSIEWRIIRITDDPIATIDETEELPQGEIGELIVRGPQVSREYLTAEPRPSGSDHNALAKIQDADAIWHRMGDVGYFDEQGRFWYCGRKSQRVVTSEGTLYTECVEAVANTHAFVTRSALVGVGNRESKTPVLVLEKKQYIGPFGQIPDEVLQRCPTVQHALLRWDSLPTDIRHNSKIRREELAVWAAKKLMKREH